MTWAELPLSEVQSSALCKIGVLAHYDLLGVSKCIHCGAVLAKHCSDGRCSVVFGSHSFTSEYAERLAKLHRVVDLIEELIGLEAYQQAANSRR